MNKTKKQIAREKKIDFMNNILPFVERDYEIKRYEHFVKICIAGSWIDYYPGAEKMMVCDSSRNDAWHEMTIDKLLFKLKIKM
jgi:hypothetical protein